jgi:cellobiose phosphorylase
MTRRFRGCRYEITVRAGADRYEMRVDGRLVPTDVVPAFDEGGTHRVTVRIPRASRPR